MMSEHGGFAVNQSVELLKVHDHYDMPFFESGYHLVESHALQRLLSTVREEAECTGSGVH